MRRSDKSTICDVTFVQPRAARSVKRERRMPEKSLLGFPRVTAAFLSEALESRKAPFMPLPDMRPPGGVTQLCEEQQFVSARLGEYSLCPELCALIYFQKESLQRKTFSGRGEGNECGTVH